MLLMHEYMHSVLKAHYQYLIITWKFPTVCCLFLIRFYIDFSLIPAHRACSYALFTHLTLNIPKPFIFWGEVWNSRMRETAGTRDKRTRIWEKTRVKGIGSGMMANIEERDRKQMWSKGKEGETGKGKHAEGGQREDASRLSVPKKEEDSQEPG